MAGLMTPDFRLSGTIVSLKGNPEQLSIRAFSDSIVYGKTTRGSLRTYNIATGLYSEAKDTRDKAWCEGDDAMQHAAQKWNLDYTDEESLALSITRISKWRASGVTTYLTAQHGWSTARRANESQERFLVQILQGQADGKQLTQGYRGLGGPEYLSFKRLYEGGVSYTPSDSDLFWYDVFDHLT